MYVQDNPWLFISPEDYERHMSHPSVNQQRFLEKCFHKALTRHAPSELLVIGCGTGNGLEHVDPRVTRRTTVIDVNGRFLNVVKQQFQPSLPGLEVIHDDLHVCSIPQECYSLVYAGLVFEFVQTEIVLKKVAQSMREGGFLEVVLQNPNETLPTVSSTGVQSMKKLKSIVSLINRDQFFELCRKMQLVLIGSHTETLESGKSFLIASFVKEACMV